VFTPVLAKHSKSFSLIDCISVGVNRMQRNFEPMRSGLPSDHGSQRGDEVRGYLHRVRDAIAGLVETCAFAVKQEGLQPEQQYRAFFAVLDRDARDSLAAIELVLAQPAISSQLVDNLNASTHLRALLTDLFLVSEILKPQAAPTKPVNTG
jgi:hypothetical protein